MAESILSFFTKIVESSPQLILLFLGAALFVISGANQLSIGGLEIPLSQLVKTGLFFIGLLLIGISLWMLLGNEKFRRLKRIDSLEKERDDLEKKKNELADEIRNLESSIVKKDVEIEKLNKTIGDAIEVSNSKGFGEVSAILIRAAGVIASGKEKFKLFSDAAAWVDIKISKWIKGINPTEYQEYGIENDNIEAFREEIAAHLRLLKSNLQEMIPDGIPSRCGVPQIVAKNRLAYVKALKSIQYQMESDVKKDQELSSTAVEHLLSYMQDLIDNTTEV